MLERINKKGGVLKHLKIFHLIFPNFSFATSEMERVYD